MQDEHVPNSCKTCRQKRVRCDRLLPRCQRCASSLLPCLGYERKKKVVWANSMASRGKMMGRATFDTIDHARADIAVTDLCPSSPSESCLVDPAYNTYPEAVAITYDTFIKSSLKSVVYNNSSFNPFLSLMPLMPFSQALSHIMISISAFHIAHRLDISQAQLKLDHSEVLRIALLNKQKALTHLKLELKVQPGSKSDALIAAVLLFVNLDVVEFAGRGWKYHLPGAEELIKIQKGLVKDGSEGWLQYFDTACTTFGILGGTLIPSHSLRVVPMALDPTFLDAIRRSEHLTWSSCPASLLSLLHAINTLRAIAHGYGGSDKTVASIIDDIQSFSPLSWATDFPDAQHYESRYHLTYAYKAAVSIYASHIIRETVGQLALDELDIPRLTELGISHMSQISVNDFHIKSLVRPAFILGAEAQGHDIREKVRTIMQSIWVSSCCYNVRTALGMLDRIWEQEHGVNTARSSWLRCVWEKDESWLVL